MTHEARELENYIMNDAGSYHAYFMAAVKNLMRKRRKGTYDRSKSAKLFYYVTVNAAQQYHREHGRHAGHWYDIFPVSARWEVANSLAEEFHVEAELGNWDKWIKEGD